MDTGRRSPSAALDGEALIIIYSGDTIMSPEGWNSQVLSRRCIAMVLDINTGLPLGDQPCQPDVGGPQNDPEPQALSLPSTIAQVAWAAGNLPFARALHAPKQPVTACGDA